jgi:hypothetical protein
MILIYLWKRGLFLKDLYYFFFDVFNVLFYLRVQNSTTPLWNIPYDKQIEQKRSDIVHLLRKTHFKIDKANGDIFYWLQQQK